MSVILVSLHTSTGTTISHTSGDQVVGQERLSERALQADLVLWPPSGDLELENVGEVRVQVTVRPRGALPDRNNQQTVEWLVSVLQRMLADHGKG